MWRDGLPPEDVDVAWLKVWLVDDDGDAEPCTVLAVRDPDGEWSEAVDWRGESCKEVIDDYVSGWQEYQIPDARGL